MKAGVRPALSHLLKEVVLPYGGDNLPDDRSVFHLRAGRKAQMCSADWAQLHANLVVTYHTAGAPGR